MDSVTLAKIRERLREIDDLIEQEAYEEAAQKIDEYRLFLQKNADMKSQNLLNKNYAKCMFYITRNAYSEERDERKFRKLFEKNRSLVELHHSKADYLYLIRIDERLKKKRKRKILTTVLTLGILMIVGGTMTLKPSMLNFQVLKLFEPKQQEVVLNHSEESDEMNLKNEGKAQPNAEIPLKETLSEESGDRVYAQEPEEIEPEEFETEEEPVLPEDEYVLDSWSHLLTLEEVQDMTAEQIRMAINEIYARHGHRFRGANQAYFESKSWYVAAEPAKTAQEITQSFSDIERKNMSFLIKRERYLKGR